MLKLKDLVKNYYVGDMTVEALKGVNLCFRKNEFVSILGPSGCGKTTLLNIIGGLDKYTSGDVFINGKSTKEYTDRDWDVYRNHRIGFIFQSYNLIPHQTVLGNVELALTISGISKAERVERAKKALDRVGLKNQYNKHPNQLSGGQCQRVAIARALVNEPEILLADEPTGALDTETSVQIMDLIKEIANEKLVIMVTHNPDLAYKYSTRIVKFLDGQLVDDSNPFTEEEEQQEIMAIEAEEKEKYEAELAKIDQNAEKALKKFKKEKSSKERAKMSFWTAFKLSARNLWSKRARTIMVGIAGSIGIIGVASVLSVSTGVRDYITSVQDDLLSGNPIRVTESSIDLTTLMNSSSLRTKAEAMEKGDWVNVNKIIDYLMKNQKELTSITSKNEINQQYVDFVKSMPEEYYQAISLDYGIEIRNNLYTDYTVGTTRAEERMRNGVYSLTAINAIYAQAITHLSEDFAKYSDTITGLSTPLSQCVPNNDYIKTQYDVVAGSLPTNKNDLVLVLDDNNSLSDLVLAQLGYYSQEEFYALVYKSMNNHVDEPIFKDRFQYDEILNRKFYWYPNDAIFERTSDPSNPLVNNYNYRYKNPSSSLDDQKETLNVVGIVKPKKGVSYGALETGLLYQEDFARHMIKKNKTSQIAGIINSVGGTISNPMSRDIYTEVDDVMNPQNAGLYEIDDNGKYVLTGDTTPVENKKYYFYGGKFEFQISYNLDYYWEKTDDNLVGNKDLADDDKKIWSTDTDLLYVAESNALSQILKIIPGLDKILGGTQTLSLEAVGGSTLPTAIYIYPNNFKDKDLVTNYLDKWSSKETLKIYKFDEDYNKIMNSAGYAETYVLYSDDPARTEIKYSDPVGLIVNIINQLINIVTYALVAFTALSLVVSSVMIAIITYVSVMERIKEIGVIRSLGGRKKDVSHLFNAETFIIGFGSGVIGIVVTGVLCIIANIIVATLSNGMVRSIAHLTVPIALIMVLVSVLLTSISGLIPARSAAKKDPVVALRTE